MTTISEPTESPRAKTILPPLLLVLLASVLPLAFNIFIFHEMQSLTLSLLSYISSAALTLFILTVSCRIRTLGFIILPVLFIFAFLTWFIYHQYGIIISLHVVSSIIETDSREAASFITIGNAAMVLVPLLALAALVLAGHKFISKKASNIMMIVSLAVFGIFAGVSTPVAKSWQLANSPTADSSPYIVRCLAKGMFWPVRETRMVTKMVKQHFSYNSHVFHQITNMPSGYEPPAEGESGEEDMIVVLMLGESVRADHLQLNGYGRETTPLLAKRTEQLVSYPRTCSFGLFTRVSVVGMLTDAEIANRTVYHRPFIDMLNLDGYKTACVTLLEESVTDSQVAPMMQDCQLHYSIDPRVVKEGHAREETLTSFDKAMQEMGDTPKAFYLVYDAGAHIPYERVEANKRFLPDDISSNPAESPVDNLVNAYDNCLLEIDWELDALIQKLEGAHRSAVLVYASDHGEALGENGVYIHGAAVEPVYSPAIFVWCSREYIEKYPERFAALQANASKAVSHDHIMHTVLSVAGIRRGAYKAELDLTTPAAKETPVPEDKDSFFELSCQGERTKHSSR